MARLRWFRDVAGHQEHGTEDSAGELIAEAPRVSVVIERRVCEFADAQRQGSAGCFEFQPNVGPFATESGSDDVGVDVSRVFGRTMSQQAALDAIVDNEHAGVVRMKRTLPCPAELAVKFLAMAAHFVEVKLHHGRGVCAVKRDDLGSCWDMAAVLESFEQGAQSRFEIGNGESMLHDRFKRIEAEPLPGEHFSAIAFDPGGRIETSGVKPLPGDLFQALQQRACDATASAGLDYVQGDAGADQRLGAARVRHCRRGDNAAVMIVGGEKRPGISVHAGQEQADGSLIARFGDAH